MRDARRFLMDLCWQSLHRGRGCRIVPPPTRLMVPRQATLLHLLQGCAHWIDSNGKRKAITRMHSVQSCTVAARDRSIRFCGYADVTAWADVQRLKYSWAMQSFTHVNIMLHDPRGTAAHRLPKIDIRCSICIPQTCCKKHLVPRNRLRQLLTGHSAQL